MIAPNIPPVVGTFVRLPDGSRIYSCIIDSITLPDDDEDDLDTLRVELPVTLH